MAFIHPIVEGDIDAAVATRLIEHTGHVALDVYGRRGCGYIKAKIGGFNKSAQGSRYLALVDLMDTGHICPGNVVSDWLPNREPAMHFRVVVREIESWLLADVEGMSELFGVARAHFPVEPETLGDPKETLVNLARRSRRRGIKSAIVPEEGISSVVGPAYNSEIRNFVETVWDPDRARARAHSLTKCIDRLNEIPI